MMVETSAIVAMMLEEANWRDLLARIDAAEHPFTTTVAVFEASLVVTSRKSATVQDTLAKVMRFVDAAAIAVVPLDNDALDHAADAAQRYGKGRGHPAQLNLCDCLAYGAARAGDASLLFVGQDFARTDIARTDIAPA